MTLLEDIQNAAVDSKHEVGTLLRKCKVLAARLDIKSLEDWVLWESNGYPAGAEVPAYRIWQLELFGNFQGPFGAALKNYPVPFLSLPTNARDSYERYKCRQSVASLETMLSRSLWCTSNYGTN